MKRIVKLLKNCVGKGKNYTSSFNSNMYVNFRNGLEGRKELHSLF